MGCGLLVARRYELDPAARERIKDGDVGVATETEDDLDAVILELPDKDLGSGGRQIARGSPLITVQRWRHAHSSAVFMVIQDLPGTVGDSLKARSASCSENLCLRTTPGCKAPDVTRSIVEVKSTGC